MQLIHAFRGCLFLLPDPKPDRVSLFAKVGATQYIADSSLSRIRGLLNRKIRSLAGILYGKVELLAL
jgi:hypothetical protein